MKKRVLLLIMCVFAMTAASAQITSVAIVGAGVGGWPTDNNCGGPVDQNQMTKVDADNWILADVIVTGGGIKFRANNCWNDATGTPAGLNLGRPKTGSAWPSAIGDNAGSSGDINAGVIPGTYTVKLNTATLAYSFEGGAPIPVVKLVGTAVDGGTGSVDLISTTATTFEAKVVLLAGNAKFDVDGVLLSDSAFPSGTAFEGGTAIPVTAGEWVVKYNSETGDYSFETPPFVNVVIRGNAALGWGTDLPLTTTDGIVYTLASANFVALEPGTANPSGFLIIGDPSFDPKWGGAADGTDIFATPTGTLALGGSDLRVGVDGTYSITFNRLTLEYTTTSLSTKGFSTANFKVSPNPTTNNWNFTTANDSIESIQILDVLGKNVMSISPRSTTANVDASSLTRGIYFAKVATAKASQTLKLMKN